jgi:hypothetical protein
MGRDESVLVRVSSKEHRLLDNYRLINEVRQDTLLYFSDELIKLEAQDQASAKNVVPITTRK